MATADVLTPVDFTKQTHTNNTYPLVSPKREKKQLDIPLQRPVENEQSNRTEKYAFEELDNTRQIRIRSLSHWLHFKPDGESMALAGWFSCNASDRVMCIYCHTICQGWTMNDDPAEVHKRLAPQCPFVRAMSSTKQSPKIVNDSFLEKYDPFHPKMAELPSRERTFSRATWLEDAPTVDSLVRAGFFWTGVENIVTCFYCNGSLHKWSSIDNPMIQHAQWFPNCTYTKHLCGEQLYQRIVRTKKRVVTNDKISEEDLPRMVAARMDLPIVKSLRSQYQLPIIKHCLVDQLKIKNDDFQFDGDWRMACFILQKQIEIIQGNKDKVIVPSKHQQTAQSSELPKHSLGECFICLTEEKQLACMPCGHLCACVPCGYGLRSCPVCREKIQCFMRINS